VYFTVIKKSLNITSCAGGIHFFIQKKWSFQIIIFRLFLIHFIRSYIMSIMNLLDQMLQSGRGAVQKSGHGGHVSAQGNPLGSLLTGMGGGALAAGTIGVLMGSKKARKIGGSALKYGGLAALGLVAYKAFNTWQQNNSSAAQMPTPDG
jgi:phosphatidylglycerophosphate synthase